MIAAYFSVEIQLEQIGVKLYFARKNEVKRKFVNFVTALLFTPHDIYVKIGIHRQPPL